LAFGL